MMAVNRRAKAARESPACTANASTVHCRPGSPWMACRAAAVAGSPSACPQRFAVPCADCSSNQARRYVDTAGEQLYIKSVFDTFSGEAERAGVTVIPATNDGCLPGDLIAHLLAEQIERIEEISVSHFIVGGGPSRGSLRSVAATTDAIPAHRH